MKTNGTLLVDALNRLIKNGEIPYQANRRAVSAFDIFLNGDEGKQELLVMLEGIDVALSGLEAYEHALDVLENQVRAAIR